MGLFGSKKEKVEVEDPMFDIYKPLIERNVRSIGTAFGRGQLSPKPFQGDRVADATPARKQSWNMISNLARNPSEILTGAQGYANDVISGNYLRANPADVMGRPSSNYYGKVMGGNYFNQPNANLIGQPSSNYLEDLVSGKYLGANAPGMDAVLRKATNAVNANYSAGGRYGSGAHDSAITEATGGILYDNYARERGMQDAAAKALADVRFQNYGQERGYQQSSADTQAGINANRFAQERGFQQQAMQFAPELDQARYFGADKLGEVGVQQQAQRQAEIEGRKQRWDEEQARTLKGLQNLHNLLPGSTNAQTQTTKSPGIDPLQLLIGGSLGFFGL